MPAERRRLRRRAALKGYTAGADPVVRAGTNGMFYYAGIAFTRDSPKKSAVFVSRFIDNNNEENGDPIKFVSTDPVATGHGHRLHRQAVDGRGHPARRRRAPAASPRRRANGIRVSQTFPGGNVYVAYTTFTDESKPPSQIHVRRARPDCGATWSKPLASSDNVINQGATLAIDPVTGTVYLAWRRFKTARPHRRHHDREVHRWRPDLLARPGKWPTSTPSIRAPPVSASAPMPIPPWRWMASGRVYLAWSERNAGAPDSGGDARIVLTTSRDGQHLDAAR